MIFLLGVEGVSARSAMGVWVLRSGSSRGKRRDGGGLVEGGGWPPKGMMVEFVKQVHLQNEVGAM